MFKLRVRAKFYLIFLKWYLQNKQRYVSWYVSYIDTNMIRYVSYRMLLKVYNPSENTWTGFYMWRQFLLFAL